LDPRLQVRLEKMHKTHKQGIFCENTLRDLERRLPRGGKVYFSEFSTPKSFFFLAFETKGVQLPLPSYLRGLMGLK
jgi:hypothetical protein